jgi:fructoselysine-6-P-deglycase FrlB-like protein
MRTIVFWLALFVAGLLIGFIPQYVKARDLKRQVNVCNAAYQLAEARRSATLTYVSASQLNYGTASSYANQFFDQVHQIAATTSDSSARAMLTDILSARDKIMGDLSKGNPQVVSELQPIVLEIEGASNK